MYKKKSKNMRAPGRMLRQSFRDAIDPQIHTRHTRCNWVTPLWSHRRHAADPTRLAQIDFARRSFRCRWSVERKERLHGGLKRSTIEKPPCINWELGWAQLRKGKHKAHVDPKQKFKKSSVKMRNNKHRLKNEHGKIWLRVQLKTRWYKINAYVCSPDS